MIRGDQFLKMLEGTLKVDEDKLRHFTEEFTSKYPHGDLEINRAHFSIKVKCRRDGDIPLCLVCGNKMVKRVNQFRKNGIWVLKKKRDNISNWECPKCYPDGHAPLIVGDGIGET